MCKDVHNNSKDFIKDSREEENMARALNLGKVTNKLATPISSEQALKDVIPFNWSKEVVDGTKKIIVSGATK